MGIWRESLPTGATLQRAAVVGGGALDDGRRRPDSSPAPSKQGSPVETLKEGQEAEAKRAIRQAERFREWYRLGLVDLEEKRPATVGEKAAKGVNEGTWNLSIVWGEIITDNRFLAAVTCKPKLIKLLQICTFQLPISDTNSAAGTASILLGRAVSFPQMVQEPAASQGPHRRSF